MLDNTNLFHLLISYSKSVLAVEVGGIAVQHVFKCSYKFSEFSIVREKRYKLISPSTDGA